MGFWGNSRWGAPRFSLNWLSRPPRRTGVPEDSTLPCLERMKERATHPTV
jgi:hypothetical protein